MPMQRDMRLFLGSLAFAVSLAAIALAFPDMSRLITVPMAVIALGFAVYFLLPELRGIKMSANKVLFSLLAFSGAASIVGLAVYSAWHLSLNSYSRPSGNPLDNEISVNCDPSMPPTAFSENENIYVFELGAPPRYDGFPAPVAGAQTSFTRGSGAISWTPKPGAGSFAKCTIANYSGTALIDVFLKMPVFYSPILGTKTEYTGGKPFGDRYVFSPLLNLGPSSGNNSTADFYIWNATDYFTQAEIPETIQLSVAGSLERQTVQLIPAAFPGYAVMQPDVLPTSIKGPPN